MNLKKIHRIFVLDLLSDTIIRNIFDYLSADDILYSFKNTSSYINDILLKYDNYHVNLKSILKQRFDLICDSLRADQIISLALSDSDETPDQSRVFLARFPIEQFSILRSLRLFDIDNENQLLFNNIYQLKTLTSFETDKLSHVWMLEKLIHIQQLIINKYHEDDYYYAKYFDSISFSNICRLTLPYCPYKKLHEILNCCAKLNSLNISMIISDCTGIDYFAEQHQDKLLDHLIDLKFSINSFTRVVSRLLFEQFLYRTPNLQHLELIVSSGGSSNLLQAKQWEIFMTKHLPLLTDFNFKFQISYVDSNKIDIAAILQQFCSEFWLNRKPKFYVSYNMINSTFYTVPHFAPEFIKYSTFLHTSHITTLPIEQYSIYADRIKELELDSSENSQYQYKYVQRLILSTTAINENLIDMSKLEYLCLKIQSIPWKRILKIIKQSMVRLYHLKIDCQFAFNQSKDFIPLEQIRILHLPQFSYSSNNKKIDICSLFPNVERLIIGTSNFVEIVYLIDGFTYLSNASFQVTKCEDDLKRQFDDSHKFHQWLIQNSTRLAKNPNFTYRLNMKSDTFVHIWMASENVKSNKILNQRSKSRCGCSIQ